MSLPVSVTDAVRPPRAAELEAAFIRTFTSEFSLNRITVLATGRTLDQLTPQGPLEQRIFHLLFQQVMDDAWLPNLVTATCLHHPGSQHIPALAQAWGWVDAPLPGLTAALEAPPSRKFATRHKAKLTRMAQSSQAIADLKELHDLLEQIRRSVACQLKFLPPRFPSPGAAEELGSYRSVFRGLRARMVAVASSPALKPSQFAWVGQQLGAAGDNLRHAETTNDRRALEQGIGILQHVVESQMPGLDNAMSGAAGNLDPSAIQLDLDALRSDLAEEGCAPAILAGVDADIERIVTVATNVTVQVEMHTLWQRVDSDLSMLELLVRKTPDAVSGFWPIPESNFGLVTWGEEEQVALVRAAVSQMALMVGTGDRAAMEEAAETLAVYARDWFLQVDRALLLECEALRVIGQGLARILERMDA